MADARKGDKTSGKKGDNRQRTNDTKRIKDMEFRTNDRGQLMVSKEALVAAAVYSEQTYRNSKSKGRFEEYAEGELKYVLLESLPAATRAKVLAKYEAVMMGMTQLTAAARATGGDCTGLAVSLTAETLKLNEPMVRSSMETYINAHKVRYTGAYLDANLRASSVKGYARQCAMVAWMGEMVKNINNTEPDATRASRLLRSLRVNMLQVVQRMELEVKIPTTDANFNRWVDEVLAKLDAGVPPEHIVTVKRRGNNNGGKITDEQLTVALSWYKNGTNMSVREIYKRWRLWGEKQGWWMEAGEYCPPTEARLYQLISPLKNPMVASKIDGMEHQKLFTPTVDRMLPTRANEVWGIDGTAHNENVEHGGKTRQHLYTIKVIDVATLRLVGVSTYVGSGEPLDKLQEAILMGIRLTGHKPAVLQCDHGAVSSGLDHWLESLGIECKPCNVGNSRGKNIEPFFNMFDNAITRYIKGFSGMNLTANGSITSKTSSAHDAKGKRHSRDAQIAAEWTRTEGVKLWNERIIERLDKMPCGKTPYELYDEKESFTSRMNTVDLAMLCGTRHDRMLTIDGLKIQHENVEYTYFPPIETSEQRERAEQIFRTIPLDKHSTSKLAIYIIEGGKPAPVFTSGGQYLGTWGLKEKVPYTAAWHGTDEDNAKLEKNMALNHRVKAKAQELAREIDEFVERHPDGEAIKEMGTKPLAASRREYKPRYHKETTNETEVAWKAGGTTFEQEAQPRYEEVVDPDTGKVHRFRIN